MNYKSIITYSLLIIFAVGVVTATMNVEQSSFTNNPLAGSQNTAGLNQQEQQPIQSDTSPPSMEDATTQQIQNNISTNKMEYLPGRVIVEDGDDQTPPFQSFEYGNPKTTIVWFGNTYPVISCTTPIYINSTDFGENATGVSHITYSLWYTNNPYPNQHGIIESNKLYDKTIYDNQEGDDNPTPGVINTVIHVELNCFHEIIYQCWDVAGNSDGRRDRDFFSDCCPPVTTKDVGQPQYGDIYPTWASDETPLWFNATDYCCLPNGTGVSHLVLEIYWKDTFDPLAPWMHQETITIYDNQTGDDDPREGRISYLHHFNQNCFHEIHWYAVDMLDNTEPAHKQKHKIDISPPAIITDVGEPHCTISDDEYCVDPATPINISAVDQGCQGGVGVKTLRYQIWYNNTWGDWMDADPDGSIIYLEEPCTHIVKIYAEDYLGNQHIQNITFSVDTTAPVITKTVGQPQCMIDEVGYCVSTTTPITIDASSDDCCPSLVVWYTINNGSWVSITDQLPYNLSFETTCSHDLVIKAFDCLGHTSWDNETFFVDTTPPTINTTIGQPSCMISDDEYCITPSTPITLDAYNDDCCQSEDLTVYYQINNGSWMQLTEEDLPYTLFIEESCNHTFTIIAEDCLGNNATEQYLFHVDSMNPDVELRVHDPSCFIDEQTYCVKTTTPLTLDAWDYSCCDDLTIWYRTSTTSWTDITDSVPYNYSFSEECTHYLELYAFDCLGNSAQLNYTFYVNDHPPAINITVDDPSCELSADEYCITSETMIHIDSYHQGCCQYEQLELRYKINEENWTYPTTLPVTLSIPDECNHTLFVEAEDCLRNMARREVLFHVDNSLPEIKTTIGQPNLTGSDESSYLISCATPITIDVENPGCCTTQTTVRYRINEGRWNNITNQLPYLLQFTEDCMHHLHIEAEDCYGNIITDDELFYVDCTAPNSTKLFEGPTYDEDLNNDGDTNDSEEQNYWVKANDTIICLSTQDEGNESCTSGLNYTHIELWWDSDNDDEIDTQLWEVNDTTGIYCFSIMQDCLHEIRWYTIDYLGNRKQTTQQHRVDSMPPATTHTTGKPVCIDSEENITYVSTNTPIWLNTTDTQTPCAVGCNSLVYTISLYNQTSEEWNLIASGYEEDNQAEIYFTEECFHRISWYSQDYLGNQEDLHQQYYRVDNTPPVITKTIGEPSFTDDNQTWWVTTDTEINLTAVDPITPCTVGGVQLHYRYKIGDSGQWTTWREYTGNITFDEGCTHYVSFRAQDCLSNAAYDNQTFIVHGPSGESSPKVTIDYPVSEASICDEYLSVRIHAVDDQTPWEHLQLGLYLPGGRRNAPTLWYEVTPAQQEDYFIATIPLYLYQNGAELTLHAYAVDEENNTGFAIPVTFTVCSSTLWDQWMQEGWNLLMLPPGVDCNNSVQRVFSSIDGNYDLIYHYDTEDGWSSFWTEDEQNDLTTIEAGKQYWVHITNTSGIRYYIGLPQIFIQHPEDQSTHSYLNHTSGITWNSETGIKTVHLQLYYREQSTMYWWNGSNWTTTMISLLCELHSGYLQNWSYNTTAVDWRTETTYTIKVQATDIFECTAYDSHSFTIYGETTT